MHQVVSIFAAILATHLCLVELTWAFPKPELIFPRQDDGSFPTICTPSCEFGTCAGLACPGNNGRRVKRAWDLPLMNNESLVDEKPSLSQADLVKRFFRLNAGSRPVTNYRGTSIKFYIAEQWSSDGDYDNQYQGEENRYIPAEDAGRTPRLFYSGPEAPGGDERAMSQQYPFFDGNGNPVENFEIGQSGMTGCTVLALVSKRGVWMAHLWEIYSHGRPSQDFLQNQNAASFQAFSERSLRFLTDNTAAPNPSAGLYTEGDPKPYIRPDGEAIDRNLFNRANDNTQLILFVPAADNLSDRDLGRDNFDPALDQNYRTPQRNRLIVDTVRLHLSRQNDAQGRPIPADIRVDYVPYEPLKKDLLDSSTYRGRGLVYFQFDRDADGMGARAWRVFMEGRVFLGDAAP